MDVSGRTFRMWLAAVLLAAAGCALDGGVGGTGISTLNGNVANGGGAASYRTTADHSGITVRLRETDLQTVTDNTGWFQLEGRFAGDVTVEFTEADNTTSTMNVDVPAGAEVTLVNIRFNRPLRTAQAERIDLDFEAVVLENPTCDNNQGVIRVRDLSETGNIFSVRISPSTGFESDANNTGGAPPSCTDLRAQQILRIRATEEEDGAVTATRIRLIKSRQPGRGGQL